MTVVMRLREGAKLAFDNYFFRLILIGFAFSFICSLWFDIYGDSEIGQTIIRDDYTVGELVFWVGGIGKEFIWLWAAFKKWGKWLFYKICMRLYFDFLLVDLGYLLFSNPHELNRSKWECIVASIVVFFIHCVIASRNKKML